MTNDMKYYKLTALIIIFLSTVFTAVKSCPRYWKSFDRECIYFTIGTNFPFEESRIVCLFFGGKLVSVSSEEMLEFLSINKNSYRDTNFWVGVEKTSEGYKWMNGFPIAEQPWVEVNESIDSSCFIYTGAKIKNVNCNQSYPQICSRPMTHYNPKEKCLEGLTEHSFIGDVSGNCVFRTPSATTQEKAEDKCAEFGGRFLDLDGILAEGLNSFVDHKVMANDGLKYWTGFTVNGTQIYKSSGELFEEDITMQSGTGECLTVTFNVEDVLKTQLLQTDCKDHAYVICATLPPSPPPEQQQLLSCPPGQNWRVYPNTDTCFWETSFETSRLSWGDARRYCQAFGGDLASFHSNDEEKIGLSFQYGTLAHPYWIGLYFDPDTETYRWSDGSPLDYQNWAPGHPNHRDKRLRCVAMDAEETHWVSSLCGIVSWFVCKAPKRANPQLPVIPTPEPLVPCDRTGLSSTMNYYFKGYCYRVVDSRYTWHRAKEFCENTGSTLASIHSEDEIAYLLKLLYYNRQTNLGNRAWIGLNSLRTGVLRWTDWTPVDFTFWNENEPNNHDNQEKCVNIYIGNGLWNDENCNSAMSFICKLNKDANVTVEVPTTRDPTIGNCQKGWYPHRDRCYLPIGITEKEKANWTDAKLICQGFGGYLVSIRDAAEQAYLSYLMQGQKDDVWIGLHDTVQSGQYFWVDNSDILYTNWAPGEPSFFGIQEDCVKMSYDEVNSGVWRDDECSRKLSYICQTEKDPDLPKPEYNRGLNCIYPEGWLKLEDMCFKMFAGNPKTWQEAEVACERQGAHLVSLSGASVQAVATYLGMEVNQTYWIGLKYDRPNQKFKWLNEWPLTISKWGKNEPSNLENDDICYTSSPDGYWKSVPCNQQMPFICQITAGKPPVRKVYTGDCPNTSELWIPTDGSFCHIYEAARSDWFTANLRCFRYGSYLISIHSKDELEQIRKTLKSGYLTVYIGLVRNDKDGFLWTDQSPVDFLNWDEDEPQKSSENCVAMMADTLKWRLVPCLTAMPLLCASNKVQEIDALPENAKYSDGSSGGLEVGALAGILVCVILVLVFIVLGVVFCRPTLGRSRFRNPFRQHSISYENALYSVDSASMEFQDKHT